MPNLSEDTKISFKVVLHLEAGKSSLQSWTRAGNDSQHHSEFQGDIVPEHYGVFVGKTSCGGTIVCAVLEYFPGLPWTWIRDGPGDTLESQYVHFSCLIGVTS